MGLFDYVNFAMACPQCGRPLRGFQSKDRDCDFETLEIDDVQRFYTICHGCQYWVEFSREFEPPVTPTRPEPSTQERALALGFTLHVEPPPVRAPESAAPPAGA